MLGLQKKEDDPRRPCKCRTLLFLWNNRKTTMKYVLRSIAKKLKKVDGKAWRYPFPSVPYIHGWEAVETVDGKKI